MCLAGICFHTLSLHWPVWSKSVSYAFLETCLYVSMGWLAIIMWESLNLTLKEHSFAMIFNGGGLYMAGLVFFVYDQVKIAPAMHAIWHVFVLSASICHYIAIRHLIVDHLSISS